MSKKPAIHVVKSGGAWATKKEGSAKPMSRHRTQAAAEQAAKRELRKNGGGEAVIHRPNGQIRDKDTVPPAKDPFPPRDSRH